VHYIPLHLHPYWKGRYGFTPESFPEAHRKFTQEISLPIYTTLTAECVERIIQAVLSVGTPTTEGMSDVKKTLQGNSIVIQDIRDVDALSVFVKRSTISRGRVLRVVLPDLPAGSSP
jgi:(2Fe-2S) ferredoxin